MHWLRLLKKMEIQRTKAAAPLLRMNRNVLTARRTTRRLKRTDDWPLFPHALQLGSRRQMESSKRTIQDVVSVEICGDTAESALAARLRGALPLGSGHT